MGEADRDRSPGRSGQERKLGLRHSFRVLDPNRPLRAGTSRGPLRSSMRSRPSLTHPWPRRAHWSLDISARSLHGFALNLHPSGVVLQCKRNRIASEVARFLKPEASKTVAGGRGAQRRHHRYQSHPPASRRDARRPRGHVAQPGLLRSLRIGSPFAAGIRGCRFAQPPATIYEAFSFAEAAVLGLALAVSRLHKMAKLQGAERRKPDCIQLASRSGFRQKAGVGTRAMAGPGRRSDETPLRLGRVAAFGRKPGRRRGRWPPGTPPAPSWPGRFA